jgi:hypothetical protein
MPSVEFHVASHTHDSAGHKMRITIDISSCILTPQLNLRLPGCLSALELCSVKAQQQVQTQQIADDDASELCCAFIFHEL